MHVDLDEGDSHLYNRTAGKTSRWHCNIIPDGDS